MEITAVRDVTALFRNKLWMLRSACPEITSYKSGFCRTPRDTAKSWY